MIKKLLNFVIFICIVGSINGCRRGVKDCITTVPRPIPWAISIGYWGNYNCMPNGATTSGPFDLLNADMGKLKVTVTGNNWGGGKFNQTTVFTHNPVFTNVFTGVVTLGQGTLKFFPHTLEKRFGNDLDCLLIERPIQADIDIVGGVERICGETEMDIVATIIQGGSNTCPLQPGSNFCARYVRMQTITLDPAIPQDCISAFNNTSAQTINQIPTGGTIGTCN